MWSENFLRSRSSGELSAIQAYRQAYAHTYKHTKTHKHPPAFLCRRKPAQKHTRMRVSAFLKTVPNQQPQLCKGMPHCCWLWSREKTSTQSKSKYLMQHAGKGLVTKIHNETVKRRFISIDPQQNIVNGFIICSVTLLYCCKEKQLRDARVTRQVRLCSQPHANPPFSTHLETHPGEVKSCQHREVKP
jgi:hypothetical protein